jgi:hypothetical protein
MQPSVIVPIARGSLLVVVALSVACKLNHDTVGTDASSPVDSSGPSWEPAVPDGMLGVYEAPRDEDAGQHPTDH